MKMIYLIQVKKMDEQLFKRYKRIRVVYDLLYNQCNELFSSKLKFYLSHDNGIYEEVKGINYPFTLYSSLKFEEPNELEFFKKLFLYFDVNKKSSICKEIKNLFTSMSEERSKMIDVISNAKIVALQLEGINENGTIHAFDILENKYYDFCDINTRRNLSSPSGQKEADSMYFCATLYQYDDIVFLDNTLVLRRDNPSVNERIEDIKKSNYTSVQKQLILYTLREK